MNPGHQTLESMSQAYWYNQWTLKQFSKYLKGDILEVGCGIGTFTKKLMEFGSVTGIDIDKRNLKSAYQELGKRVGVGDIEKGRYFFKSKKFDVIVCLNVLEHIKDDHTTLKNIQKLLKPKGVLVLLVPSHQFLYGEIDRAIGHYRRYNMVDLKKLISKLGFTIKNGKHINLLGGIGWFIAGRLFKNQIVESSKIGVFNLIAPIILPIEGVIKPPFGTSILLVAQKGAR
jgi:SAM-dependent methyltransferase